MSLTLPLEAAVADADAPVLLVAVAQYTGDTSILRDEFRPDTTNLFDPNAGLSEETVAAARALAADVLGRHLADGNPQAPAPDDAQLEQMIRFLVGDEPATTYRDLLREELAPPGTDLRAPAWNVADLGTTFSAAVIGAGMSGIIAAHRLLQAGVDVTVFEKNADVGGTWYENTYPGCRVDVPNHLYSYSFLQSHRWPGFFSDQSSLLDYFRWCADELGLRDRIRFSTEVRSCIYDEDHRTWTLDVGDGEIHTFDAVCSAVGQLNRPRMPSISGMDEFAGPSFHSAQWRHDLDLHGKRVGVIGTGASGAQFIPVVGEQAAHLTVFMRTAPWLVPTPNYHDELPDGLRHVMEILPDYVRWDRLWLFWRTHEGLLPAAKVDPDWQEPVEKSISVANEMVRILLTEYLRTEFPEDELFDKIVPNYPPIAKRIVRDNGVWAKTLRADNCDLVTEQIEAVTATGIRTADGVDHDFDVLIYGTGFEASRFLMPMQVTGRGGTDLHARWDGDARAYLGVVVPEFPNLFMCYGPNTNIVINGSIIYFSELEVGYMLGCIHMALQAGKRAAEVKAEVHDAYNEMIDEANSQMAWGASKVSAWYKNARGRVSQNWPFSLLEYWQRTRVPDPDEYLLS